jgi:LysR family transcriptional regulator, nitrogen assimilation regulatory protein
MINNNIKLQQLRHFVVITEIGKFSRASNILGIAQPALSQSIQKLEIILNTKLFLRNQQGVELTESGKLFFPKAKRILNDLLEAQEDIKTLIDEPSGNVKIFLSPKLLNLIGIKLYKYMNVKYPKIHLQFQEGFGLRGSNLIESGEIDIGVLPDWKFNKNYSSLQIS